MVELFINNLPLNKTKKIVGKQDKNFLIHLELQ